MAGVLCDPSFGEAVCAALRAQVEKLGLSIGGEPVWAEARCSEQRDPASGEVSIVADWRSPQRDGSATFFPDGRVFAEYQVLLPHPTLADRYVEAVQVWGVAERLRGEPVIAGYAT